MARRSSVRAKTAAKHILIHKSEGLEVDGKKAPSLLRGGGSRSETEGFSAEPKRSFTRVTPMPLKTPPSRQTEHPKGISPPPLSSISFYIYLDSLINVGYAD